MPFSDDEQQIVVGRSALTLAQYFKIISDMQNRKEELAKAITDDNYEKVEDYLGNKMLDIEYQYLELAIMHGSNKLFHYLLNQAGCSVGWFNKIINGDCLIHMAARRDRWALVIWMLQKSKNIIEILLFKDRYGNSLFHWAAGKERIEFLEEFFCIIYGMHEYGTSLHFLSKNIKQMQKYKEKFNLDISKEKFNLDISFEAIESRLLNIETTEKLVSFYKYYIDLGLSNLQKCYKNNKGETLLQYAERKKKGRAVKYFKEKFKEAETTIPKATGMMIVPKAETRARI